MALITVSLKELLENSESMEDVETLLHTFFCVKDSETNFGKDVQDFLHKKAINFENAAISRTFLVIYSDEKISYLAGYFSLANKPLSMTGKNFGKLSQSKKKMLLGSGHKTDKNNYVCPSVLLGQLGKNCNYPQDIEDSQKVEGKDILKASYEKIRDIYTLFGGKVLYLECDNNVKLRNFYNGNGFSLLEGYESEKDMLVFVKKLSQV
ncbi:MULTISPECIES: GNAT family acetyltransferase [Vagococcus]|uniref:GNAT family acetyltransferase n=1 Tax=Vagococcus TaxID=2737 RepID=UPI000E4EF4C2|nr:MULTISPECIES: GNAT family acetyltransferase [Vagococcus]RHH71080.1 GNAT family acetyltransferase [Vagococcus sp. AM17-17]UNM90333.1 GNAT family acetyltransferase [Vagococcus sp. CY52-2]